MRRLIINADDLGLTSGVNLGILKAHRDGLVTSTTLMACGERFSEAAELVRQAPRLSVGCHVVLVDGSPTLDADKVSSLLNSGPHFRESLINFACVAIAGRLSEDEVEAEVTAQIQKLQSAGIEVSHVDSHKHTHMFPVISRGILRAAKKCGVRAIRNPFEPLVFASLRHWKRRFQLRVMQQYRGAFRSALEQAEMVTPDGCIGIAVTGGLTAEIFEMLIENLPEGTWEFVSHPGYNDSELDKIKTRLRESRDKELSILTLDKMKDVLRQQDIKLISYREL